MFDKLLCNKYYSMDLVDPKMDYTLIRHIYNMRRSLINFKLKLKFNFS